MFANLSYVALDEVQKKIILDATRMHTIPSVHLLLDMVHKLEDAGYQITWLILDSEGTSFSEQYLNRLSYRLERTERVPSYAVSVSKRADNWKTEPHKRQRATPGKASSLVAGMISKTVPTR